MKSIIWAILPRGNPFPCLQGPADWYGKESIKSGLGLILTQGCFEAHWFLELDGPGLGQSCCEAVCFSPHENGLRVCLGEELRIRPPTFGPKIWFKIINFWLNNKSEVPKVDIIYQLNFSFKIWLLLITNKVPKSIFA